MVTSQHRAALASEPSSRNRPTSMRKQLHGSTRPSKVRQALLLVAVPLLLTSALVFGASTAAADSIWVQSFQRSSSSEQCVAPAWETPWQSSWGADSSWKPSYEMWANGGAGGWTCTRSITWARTPVPGGGAVTNYSVGDTGPAGGTIFYVAPSQQSWGRYLEVATADVSPFAGTWCNTSASIPGATGTAIGTGAANTQAMDAACSSGAGQAAADYSVGGFDDWFLPSLDELNALCKWAFNDQIDVFCNIPGYSLTRVNGGFTNDWYWSSTQSAVNSLDSLAQWFNWGDQDRFQKSTVSSFKVRAIRAF